MSTIKEAPEPKISPYLQFLYGLFNIFLLAVMVFSFLSVGGFTNFQSVQISNATDSLVTQSEIREVIEPIGSVDQRKTHRVADRLPQCSMDSCFNYSRCDGTKELLVYHYDLGDSPSWYFNDALKRSRFYTTDPEKACVFLVTVDRGLLEHGPAFESLPLWNKGLNHIVVSVADNWVNWKTTTSPDSIEMASTMTSITHQSTYRVGFDISIPVPQRNFYPNLQRLKALDRKYFLTFKGTRYLQDSGACGFRSNLVFRTMHNGDDIIVGTTCKQATLNGLSLNRPEVKADCAKDQSIYNQFKYGDLMNSTFGLIPAGRGPSSFRLLEVLSAGSIPVMVSDNLVLPFDSLIEWRRCLFVFPTSQMQRIVPTLRSLSRNEIEFRRESCLFIYREFFVDDDKIVETTAMALKARFFGVLPKLIPNVPLPPRQLKSNSLF